ncbi:MAG TPA: hydrogenase/urease maturation nickel metallochaperone HypA [Candidatus Limnocylindrales bacterium]|nr:hydrogenase/urease maturation nickel metallochaperone HypA [Candidatus Limnocylindrales bacterium]
MHEVSLVAELVEICEQQAAGRRVDVVRVRHATTIPPEALEQAFRMLTDGGSLAGARLEAEPFDIELSCGCGFDGALGHDDLAGSVAVCPSCAAVSTLHRTAELELLEVIFAGP